MSRQVNITTIDNPFDPFDDFNSWFMFDIEKGYYTSSRIARLVNLTENMTEKEETEEIERAIDEFIKIDPLDLYIKVEKITKDE
jgi:hypothetical protein